MTKAIKAARLAVSAALIGSEAEALVAGHIAGSLARRGGMNLDSLWGELKLCGVADAQMAWNAIVDGWYESGVDAR